MPWPHIHKLADQGHACEPHRTGTPIQPLPHHSVTAASTRQPTRLRDHITSGPVRLACSRGKNIFTQGSSTQKHMRSKLNICKNNPALGSISTSHRRVAVFSANLDASPPKGSSRPPRSQHLHDGSGGFSRRSDESGLRSPLCTQANMACGSRTCYSTAAHRIEVIKNWRENPSREASINQRIKNGQKIEGI